MEKLDEFTDIEVIVFRAYASQIIKKDGTPVKGVKVLAQTKIDIRDSLREEINKMCTELAQKISDLLDKHHEPN